MAILGANPIITDAMKTIEEIKVPTLAGMKQCRTKLTNQIVREERFVSQHVQTLINRPRSKLDDVLRDPEILALKEKKEADEKILAEKIKILDTHIKMVEDVLGQNDGR